MWGLLFDLDGTLALTNAWHEVAWREVLQEHGVSLSPEGYANEISGRSNAEIVGRLLPHLTQPRAEQVWNTKEARFRQLAKGLLAPAGLRELVTWAQAERLRVGVVTNAPRANAAHVIADLELEGVFDCVVAVEDVVHPKPDPEPYLLGAQRLGVAPKRCLAFEDSPSGVRAAVAAGMEVVGLLTGHEPHQLLDAGATRVARNFSDEPVQQLLRRWYA
jgi:HAD superfamily hydrolase (TIGR01509 family)